MASRLIGTDTDDPRLPSVVIAATQGTTAADLAPGDVAKGLLPACWSTPLVSRSFIPTFTRQPNPILMQSDSGLNTIYWPLVINVSGLIAAPVAPYYMLYSTDHDSGDGGIGLAYADSPLGPFIADLDNPIFVDTADIGIGTAEQCETPAVIWNPDTQLFHLYYHIAHAPSGSQQRTRVVTTPDFLTFSAPDYALQITATPVVYPGGAHHTGYFSPFLMGNSWFGYSIITAGDYGSSAMWFSQDGLDWTLDPRPMGWSSQMFDSVDDKLSTNGFRVLQINGRMWVLTGSAVFQSGVVNADIEWLMGQLSHDGRRIITQFVNVTPSDGGWEDTNRSRPEGVLVEDGVIYVYYRATDASDEEGFGVAVGVMP